MEKSLKDRIFKALCESGLISKKDLTEIVETSRHSGEENFIKTLVSRGAISERDLMAVLSIELGIPPIDLSKIVLDDKVMSLIPEKLIRRHLIVPLAKIGNDLTVVISDPMDILAIDDIKAITGCDVKLILAVRGEIERVVQNYYKRDENDLIEIIQADEADIEILDKAKILEKMDMSKEKESDAAPIVKMVDLIICEAVKKRASDIHIEPQEKSVRIRYRVDGELHEVFDLPKKNQNAIVACLKIMSNLDITETRVPQDGRFGVKIENKEIDFRVSSLPISFGNKIVMRALDKSSLSLGLEALGFLPEPLADFEEALAKPFGIILVTGPTGSGKSTTLYSVLNKMNGPDKNIITVEDPVEYQVEGITQIAVKPQIGLDFADGLRAVLRQSPDVIMVGEIRDYNTADIAVKASLTGQLVLSTLHTNDSVGAITRLENMGIEPFLIASSLIMSCAQRLMRKICPCCKVEADIPEDVIKEIELKYSNTLKNEKFYKGNGCPKCNGTGYLGRIATLETLLVDNNIRTLISERASEAKIREYLKSKKVRTLRDNAMIKFINGLTTLEEVYRIT
ncbi:MAG: GspE/PulE family protein [Candidatus Omnitrophota bacterium]